MPSGCREFKLSEDMYAQDSIELLKNSGIDFACNETRGIDVHRFGELLMSSGIVLTDDVRTSVNAMCFSFCACIHVNTMLADTSTARSGALDHFPQWIRFWLSAKDPDVSTTAG